MSRSDVPSVRATSTTSSSEIVNDTPTAISHETPRSPRLVCCPRVESPATTTPEQERVPAHLARVLERERRQRRPRGDGRGLVTGAALPGAHRSPDPAGEPDRDQVVDAHD